MWTNSLYFTKHRTLLKIFCSAYSSIILDNQIYLTVSLIQRKCKFFGKFSPPETLFGNHSQCELNNSTKSSVNFVLSRFFSFCHVVWICHVQGEIKVRASISTAVDQISIGNGPMLSSLKHVYNLTSNGVW